MPLTWSDIESHRSALTDGQYRRLKAYLLERKSMMQIAADEGAPGKSARRAKTSIVLSIGRGSTAVLCSMLGLPVRVPPPDTASPEAVAVSPEPPREEHCNKEG